MSAAKERFFFHCFSLIAHTQAQIHSSNIFCQLHIHQWNFKNSPAVVQVDSGEAAIVKVCAKQYLVENGFAESLLQLIVAEIFQITFAFDIRGVPYSSIIVHLSLLIRGK